MIFKNNNQKIELGESTINEDVKQVLLGSLLGDAYLSKTSKNASYCCSHSPRQKDYLFWKEDILKEHFRVNTKLRNNGNFKIYKLTTNCSQLLRAISGSGLFFKISTAKIANLVKISRQLPSPASFFKLL